MALRSKILNLEVFEIATKYKSDSMLPILYLLKKLINDLYINLGTDSSCDFPITNLANEYCENLGNFIKISFKGDKDSCRYLFETINQYYINLLLVENSGEFCGSAINETN